MLVQLTKSGDLLVSEYATWGMLGDYAKMGDR